MIPYINLRVLHLAGITIAPFILLLTTAILIGFTVAVSHGRRYGVSRERIAEMSLWMVALGFVGAVLFKLLYVDPMLTEAAQVRFRYHGISSFGGIFGGCVAMMLYFWRRRLNLQSRLAMLDALGFAMPFAWAIGRMGCALVHDHPGIRSESVLAVLYPSGARYDLGLLEVLFHILLACCFLLLHRSQRPAGFYFAAFFCAYGPFRFLLDQLHVNPPRYFSVTVDAYASVTAALIGLLALAAVRRGQPAIAQTGKTSCKHAFSPS
jgi:phosphatidylglycerol---prolipoprotein diacylglyceryl transferase